MAVNIVDALALAALLFGEPEAEALAGRLEGSYLVAPALLAFEICQRVPEEARREPTQRDARLATFARCARMLIEIVEVDHAETLPLAEAFGLTSYDAAYLWLARQFTAELVTPEGSLEAAAGLRR